MADGHDGVTAAVIAAGSAIGGWARVAIAVELACMPWLATAVVNVAGALLIGLLHTATLPGSHLPLGPRWRQFVLAGVLGGFTTFSILSAESLGMLLDGRMLQATGNMTGSLLLALTGVAAGFRLGQPRAGA